MSEQQGPSPEQQEEINKKLQAMLERRREEIGNQPEPAFSEEQDTSPNPSYQDASSQEEEVFAQMEQELPNPTEEPGYHTSAEFERFVKAGYGERVVKFEEGEFEGNRIIIRTIDDEEDIECLSRASGYPDSARAKVYRRYCLAFSLQTINGKRWFRRRPLTDDDDILEEKFRMILRLPPAVSSRLLAEFDDLNREMEQKIGFAKKGS